MEILILGNLDIYSSCTAKEYEASASSPQGVRYTLDTPCMVMDKVDYGGRARHNG